MAGKFKMAVNRNAVGSGSEAFANDSGAFDVAYLVNEYPKVSHTFIRREIEAVERSGIRILRIAVRGWNTVLVDPQDVAERQRTHFILQQGAVGLAAALVVTLFAKPLRFARASLLALRFWRGSVRPLPWHLIYLIEACWVARISERNRCRHLHAHFATNPAEVAALASVLAGIPYSFTVHGADDFDNRDGQHLAQKVAGARFVVAVSSYGRAQLMRVTPFEHWDKLHLIRCGVDPVAAMDLTAPPDTNRLVCVGRLCAEKGQLLLLEAVSDLRRDGLPVRLILVGDGELRPIIDSAAAAMDLRDSIAITGWAASDAVQAEISAARALVLPSLMEGLPIVLLEAMNLGRPVVSTYVAGIPEVVSDGENGWLCAAGSRSALVAAIRRCLETDPAVLAMMGLDGHRRVAEQHSLVEQGTALAALFSGVLGVKIASKDQRARQ